MAMTTSVLALSQYITYQVSYKNYTCPHHQYHYINSDVCPHFVSIVHGYFMSLHCVISFSIGGICLHTTSPLPYFHPFLYVVIYHFFYGLDLVLYKKIATKITITKLSWSNFMR